MGLSALALSALAPAFHYHQFGDPTRMARDAGISALVVFGAIVAVYGAIKSFRRDIESGTAAVCLSHGVSRRGFFVAKFTGLLSACAVFFLAVAADSIIIVRGAAIGGRIAAASGDLARIWGPSLAVALCPLVLPLVLAAALNRFFRFRFVLSANLLMLFLALAGMFFRLDLPLALGHLADLAAASLPLVVWLAAASAFAVRLRTNAAAALAALVIVVQLPFLKAWAVLPALLFFIYLGEVLFDECDIA